MGKRQTFNLLENEVMVVGKDYLEALTGDNKFKYWG